MRIIPFLLAICILFPACKAESSASSAAGNSNATDTSGSSEILSEKGSNDPAIATLVSKLTITKNEGTNDTIDCYANLQKIVAGQEIAIPIISNELNGLVSLQFTVQFDTNYLTWVGLDKNNVAENAKVTFNAAAAGTGLLPVLWYSETTEPGHFDPKLFTLRLLPKKDGFLSDVLAINSSSIITEGCYENPPCQPVRLLFADVVSKVKYEGSELALSVFPNPAKDFISIQCPKTGRPFNYHLRDATGKIIKEGRMPEAGLLRLQRNNLPAGMYLVQLDAEGSLVASQKFVYQ